MFRLLKKVPSISRKIDEERRKVYDLFEKEVVGRCEGLTYYTTLPEEAFESDEILDLVKAHMARGKFCNNGKKIM